MTRVAMLCATRRGLRILERLSELVPEAELTVISFREELHEPPFFDEIREVAERRGACFLEARDVGKSDLHGFWEEVKPDLMLAVSWRYLIPPEVYQRARLGAFVFHDSLLPAYRGFAPTVWAIINGEDHTGVTLFEISQGVDEGPIVDQQRVPMGQKDTIADVMENVTQVYLEVLERSLPGLLAGNAPRRAQDHARATYACKRLPEDNRIDWTRPANRIHDLVRAVTRPYPGAYTMLNGRRLTVWGSSRLPDNPTFAGRIPGRVVEVRVGQGAVVLAGEGALLVREVQLEGEQSLPAWEVLTAPAQTLGG